MKFSISPDQRNFLQKNGYIPFYSLLNPLELQTLSKECLGHKQMRDLFRNSEEVRKIVFNRRLVNLAYDLTHVKPLRLAFDHFFPEKPKGLLVDEKEMPLFDFFSGGGSLEERSSIKSLAGMLVLILNSSQEETAETIPAGGGYFLLPGAQVSQDLLPLSSDQRFFAISYAGPYSQYLYEERDPEGHFLKSLGYVFGDKLNDSLHPILFR